MDDDPTIEILLPEGMRPDPDTVVTQEIPLVAQTLKIPTISVPVRILPKHLLGDPIFTMAEPKPDETPLYDQLNGSRPPKVRSRRRRRMQTGDRVLLGMGSMAAVGVTFVYGMVAYGWGSGPMPQEAVPKARATIQVSAPATTPSWTPRPRHMSRPVRTRSIVIVVPPNHYTPQATHSMIVVSPSPTPTKTPEPPSASVTPSPTPTPTESRTSPSETPSGPASPSHTPASPTPSLTLEP